ncbi:hypothetical protein LZ480_16040 [Solibacillus sp. MA9]|uniref:Regulatory protein YycH-like domain-containing protein n=1 Tax=Solibacillus palustris TaxID=2908203 RepID=A0ABS9UG93_9BACL|nr:hypothetical protein [Solibacillus sp. MA9]MCH7323386.1 hypothetical protein [Solibacillus sp. MA9]
MKKLLVILAVVGLFQFASIVYYESKMLEKPIVIATEVNGDTNQINISFISNLMRPSELQTIEIDGMHFYPGHNDWFMYNPSMQPIQDQSYAKYAYYAIFAPTIGLQTKELANQLANATEGTLYFTDGYSEKVTLTHRKTAHNDFLEFIRSSAGSNGTEARYRLRKSFTLTDVNVVGDRVELTSFQINNKEVSLPLVQPIELDRKDTIFLATTDGMSRFQMDHFTIDLVGLDEYNNEIVLTHSNSLNSLPSAEWVEEVVKERGEK